MYSTVIVTILYIRKINSSRNTASNWRISSTNFKISNDFNTILTYLIYL
jgi:hypothetical protein